MSGISKKLWILGSLIAVPLVGKALHGLQAGDLLGLVGLQRHRSALSAILPAVGLVSLGAVAGAGVALVVAPSSGASLRRCVSAKASEWTNKMCNDLSSNIPVRESQL